MNYSCNLYWQLNGYIYDLAKNNHKDSYLTHLIKVCEKEINNTIFNSEFINMYQEYSSFCVSSDEYLTLFLFIKYFGLQLNNLSQKSIYYLIQVLVIEKINPEFIKRNITKFLDSYISTLTNEFSEIEERENILISFYELMVNEDINIAIVLCRLLHKYLF